MQSLKLEDLGQLSEIPEVKGVEIIELEPGEKHDLIRNGRREFFVVIALKGYGGIRIPPRQNNTYLLNPYSRAIKIDFHLPTDVVELNVAEDFKEKLRALVLHMTFSP